MKEYQIETGTEQGFLQIRTGAQELLEKCVGKDPDPAEIYQGLTTLVKEVSGEIARSGYEQHITTLTLTLEDMADQLRKFTRKKNAIHFYYYGMFQAWSDILKEQELEERDERRLWTVIGRKRTGEIMDYLYQHENAQHKELVKGISIRPSNLSTEIQIMSDVGLVRQRKMGKYVYYSLTPLGFRTYERHVKTTFSQTAKKVSAEDTYEATVLYTSKEVEEHKNYRVVTVGPSSLTEKAISATDSIYFTVPKREDISCRDSHSFLFTTEGVKVKC